MKRVDESISKQISRAVSISGVCINSIIGQQWVQIKWNKPKGWGAVWQLLTTWPFIGNMEIFWYYVSSCCVDDPPRLLRTSCIVPSWTCWTPRDAAWRTTHPPPHSGWQPVLSNLVLIGNRLAVYTRVFFSLMAALVILQRSIIIASSAFT